METVDSCADITGTILPGPPQARAPLREKKDHLDHQLDSINGHTILGSLTVLGGHSNRLHGGATPPALHLWIVVTYVVVSLATCGDQQ